MRYVTYIRAGEGKCCEREGESTMETRISVRRVYEVISRRDICMWFSGKPIIVGSVECLNVYNVRI